MSPASVLQTASKRKPEAAKKRLAQAYRSGKQAILIREAPLISAQGGESAAEREALPPSERAFSALTSSAHGEA